MWEAGLFIVAMCDMVSCFSAHVLLISSSLITLQKHLVSLSAELGFGADTAILFIIISYCKDFRLLHYYFMLSFSLFSYVVIHFGLPRFLYIFCNFIFVEREENVKADIFHAYITLLKQTKPSSIQDPDSMEVEEG